MAEITPSDVANLLGNFNTAPVEQAEITPAVQEPVTQPVVAEPVVTPPIVEGLPEGVTEIVETAPVAEPVAQAPAFNEDEYLRTNFGLSKAELQAKAKAEAQTYKTDEGKVFDELRSKGVAREVIFKVAFADTKQMTELEKVKLDYQIKYPTLTEDKLNAVLEEKFHLGELASEQDKLLGGAQLTIAAQEAEGNIAAYKATELAPNNNQAQAEAQAISEARIEQWEKSGAKANILNNFQKVPVKIGVELHGAQGLEKKNFNFDFQLSPEAQKGLAASFDNIARANGVAVGEEGQRFMQDTMQRLIWAQHGEQINQAALTQQASIIHNHYQKVFNNPSIPNQRNGINTEKKADFMDSAMNFVSQTR